MASQASPNKLKELRLPISRVKTIMKSSPHVDTVGQDGLFLVAKATELFIHHLSEEAHVQANKGTSLDYKHLAEVVQTDETLEFLREIMPRKITVKEFKEMVAMKNPQTSSDSSTSESSSDSDSDSDSDSESSQEVAIKTENGNSSGSSDSESETGSRDKENGKDESTDSDDESSKG